MLEPTAYHEAGHAFLACFHGARVVSLTIDPDRDDGPRRHGDTQILWPRGNPPRRQAELEVRVILAGPAAEMIHTELPFHPGLVAEWSDDWTQAWDRAAVCVADPRPRLAWLEQVTQDVRQMLLRDEHWAAVAALADELLAHETLDAEAVAEALAPWWR